MAIIGNLASSKEPVSVIATTGSYTVPAGSFAIVRAMAYGGMSMTINGTTVLNPLSDSWSTQIVSSSLPRYYFSSYGTYGHGVRLINNNQGTESGTAYTNATARNRAGVTQTYKLPSGTVIGGNCYKLIEVY